MSAVHMRYMALIDPTDAKNLCNESGWAARRKEAREWRALLGDILDGAGAAMRRRYLRF